MRGIVFVVSVLLVAGCAADPLVSDFNGASVKLQTSVLTPPEEALAASLAEAERICGKVGKRAEYASSRELPGTYAMEHLYLCL